MSFVCTQFKCQIVLFDPEIGSFQVLSLRVRVDFGAKAMKGYSTFPKASALFEPQHQIYKYHKQDMRWGRCSRCILQPQPTALLSSSSSCRAASMDILDSLSPLLPIVHRFWQVLRATSCIPTKLLYVALSWSPSFCLAI